MLNHASTSPPLWWRKAAIGGNFPPPPAMTSSSHRAHCRSPISFLRKAKAARRSCGCMSFWPTSSGKPAITPSGSAELSTRIRLFVGPGHPGPLSYFGRIAAEVVEMGLDTGPTNGGIGVLRLADRQVDRGLARLDVGQEAHAAARRRAAFGLRGAGCVAAVAAVMDSGIAAGGKARRLRAFVTIEAARLGLINHRGAAASSLERSPRPKPRAAAGGEGMVEKVRSPKEWEPKVRAPVLRPGPPDGRGGAGYPPQPLSSGPLPVPLQMSSRVGRGNLAHML